MEKKLKCDNINSFNILKSHRCEICDRKFKYKRNLSFHMKKEHGEKKKKFGCIYCGVKTTQLNSLYRHYRNKHEDREKTKNYHKIEE